MLGEVRQLDAVADPAEPRGRRSPRAASTCPSRSGRSAPRARRARARARRPRAAASCPAARSKPSASTTIRPLRAGFRNSKPSVRRSPRGASTRTASMRAICFSFACAWRDFVPYRKRATKRSSRAMSSAWRSAHFAWLASRAAFSWRQTCHLPGKKVERPSSSSSTEVATDSRNQRSCATRMTAASIVDELLLEPLDRGHVEVVRRLVEQQQVGAARERACERRARQLAAGERVEAAVEVGVGEAEPAQDGGRAVAPVVAASVLEARLGLAVAPQGLRRVVAARPSPPRAGAAPARPRRDRPRRRARTRAGRSPRRAAAAGRAARRARPSPRPARRPPAPSRRSGRGAASSCRPRSGRRARAGRARSTLKETLSKSGSPESSLRSADAIRTATL